jgi:hypothetical protein
MALSFCGCCQRDLSGQEAGRKGVGASYLGWKSSWNLALEGFLVAIHQFFIWCWVSTNLC